MKHNGRKSAGSTSDGKETFPLLEMIRKLPTVPAPRNFERMLYRRLGIAYFPLHRKVLIMSGLSAFACLVYLTGGWLFSAITSRLTLASVAQFFSMVYTKVMQAVGVIKIGYHLKEILLAFTNPWFFVGLAFLSSLLMLILIGVARDIKRKTVPLSNH